METIGNHNNELNARFHRNAVRQTFHELNVVCNEMNAMLDLPCWSSVEEEFYDELLSKRNRAIDKLKLQGMYL